MAFRVALPNFSKGEIAPVLYGRIDTQAYGSAAKQARNVTILPYGGLARRLGTEFVGEVLDSTIPHRLRAFQFSIDQGYALVFGQATMRPVAYGGQVVEELLRIMGATNTSPVVLTIPFHGYTTGDDIYVVNVDGMIEINNRSFRITVLDTDRVAINVDGTGFGVFAGSPDGTLRTTAPAPPPAAPVVPPVVQDPAPPVYTPPGGGGGSGGGTRGGGLGNLQQY